ncbi:hypothetical protein [Myxococcus sp. MxC21-1]|uniref:hypothetical protein n=1 Tax=Myxococcus sp. MxC21-1 TaxID=3041439 RepID=UPI003977D48E
MGSSSVIVRMAGAPGRRCSSTTPRSSRALMTTFTSISGSRAARARSGTAWSPSMNEAMCASKGWSGWSAMSNPARRCGTVCASMGTVKRAVARSCGVGRWGGGLGSSMVRVRCGGDSSARTMVGSVMTYSPLACCGSSSNPHCVHWKSFPPTAARHSGHSGFAAIPGSS